MIFALKNFWCDSTTKLEGSHIKRPNSIVYYAIPGIVLLVNCACYGYNNTILQKKYISCRSDFPVWTDPSTNNAASENDFCGRWVWTLIEVDILVQFINNNIAELDSTMKIIFPRLGKVNYGWIFSRSVIILMESWNDIMPTALLNLSDFSTISNIASKEISTFVTINGLYTFWLIIDTSTFKKSLQSPWNGCFWYGSNSIVHQVIWESF